MIFWLAYSLSKKQRCASATFKVGFLPHVLMAAFLVLLCLRSRTSAAPS